MTFETLESYIGSMRKAGEKIREEKPDFLVAPMLGSVPFIDVLSIVDDEFDASKVVYMPASSRIENVNNVIENWFYNFLGENVKSPEKFPSLLGIDEVVSGQSVTRCFKAIDCACQRKRREIKQGLVEKLHSGESEKVIDAMRNIDILTDNAQAYEIGTMRNNLQSGIYRQNPEKAKADSRFLMDLAKEHLDKKMIYRSIGIEDSKCKKRCKEYEEFKSRGRIIPVSVSQIITMDNPDYCPPRFEMSCSNGDYARFSPKVKDFVITPQYVDFLRSVAKVIGRDPDKVAPVNMKAILDSSKYLHN